MKKLRKAVFPVAGFGTRFLPATKAMPKELLPIVDNPLIQYAAEEAIAAGIDTLIFVTEPAEGVGFIEDLASGAVSEDSFKNWLELGSTKIR